MSRTIGALLAASAMLVFFVASAVGGNSLVLDPSIDMRFGHIDYANKDRTDYLKFYANGGGKPGGEVRLTLLGMSKYLTIVPKGTTRYQTISGKKVWTTQHTPARSESPTPTFMIALKVRADVPVHKLQCVKLTTAETTPVQPTQLLGGKNGACWTGKQLLNPVSR